MKEAFPAIYQSFLVDRNQRWMPQLQKMMGTETIEFVLVGAAHMLGDQGLIAQLTVLGYKVEKL